MQTPVDTDFEGIVVAGELGIVAEEYGTAPGSGWVGTAVAGKNRTEVVRE